MKISSYTVNALALIICGDGKGKAKSPYRSRSDLIEFFKDFGLENAPDFMSRTKYAKYEIQKYNETSTLFMIVEKSLDARHFKNTEYENRHAAVYLNSYLKDDGYVLAKDSTSDCAGRFVVRDLSSNNTYLNRDSIDKLSHEFAREQVEKANKKISCRDYDGAITNARSLVETIIKEIILDQDNTINFEDFNGNLNKMYSHLKKMLNLDPSKTIPEEMFKQVLTGLTSVITGLSGISNKFADRHSRSYKTHKHHAKLAVNCATTLSEFLLDTYKFQKEPR